MRYINLRFTFTLLITPQNIAENIVITHFSMHFNALYFWRKVRVLYFRNERAERLCLHAISKILGG